VRLGQLRKQAVAFIIAITAITILSLSVAASSWTIVPSDNTTHDNQLYGVACDPAGNCWAVGYYGYNSSGRAQTFIETNTGSGWIVVSSPNTSPSEDNTLSAVACATIDVCWAVGNYGNNSNGHLQTLIEENTGGGWTIVSSPNSSSTEDNRLLGVTCASPTDCWAVGFYTAAVGGHYQTLIEENTGSGWAIVNSPNTSASQSNRINGVTCASASDCLAVGGYTNGSAFQTLIEENTGSGWNIVGSPNKTAASDNLLNDVSCNAARCWAAGYYNAGNPGPSQTLIEENNGSGWNIVSSPNATNVANTQLLGIACAGSTHCWVVGFFDTSNAAPSYTLIEENNGSGWNIVSSPNATSTGNNRLPAIACVSVDECFAVGFYFGGDVGAARTLVETNSQPANNVPEFPNALAGILGAAAIALLLRRSVARHSRSHS
jgi:hypothetical protein